MFPVGPVCIGRLCVKLSLHAFATLNELLQCQQCLTVQLRIAAHRLEKVFQLSQETVDVLVAIDFFEELLAEFGFEPVVLVLVCYTRFVTKQVLDEAGELQSQVLYKFQALAQEFHQTAANRGLLSK